MAATESPASFSCLTTQRSQTCICFVTGQSRLKAPVRWHSKARHTHRQKHLHQERWYTHNTHHAHTHTQLNIVCMYPFWRRCTHNIHHTHTHTQLNIVCGYPLWWQCTHNSHNTLTQSNVVCVSCEWRMHTQHFEPLCTDWAQSETHVWVRCKLIPCAWLGMQADKHSQQAIMWPKHLHATSLLHDCIINR